MHIGLTVGGIIAIATLGLAIYATVTVRQVEDRLTKAGIPQ